MNNKMNRDSAAGGHLDLLRIDAVRAGEGTAAEADHVRACPICSALVAEFTAAALDLRRDLRTADVPAEVDAAILARFRETLREEPRLVRFPAWRRWLVPAAGFAAAAAATVLLALPILREGTRQREMAPRAQVATAPPAAKSVAGDGRPVSGAVPAAGPVTIVDAMRLAKLLRSGADAGPAMDVNHDGRVDGRDVEALARQAVAL